MEQLNLDLLPTTKQEMFDRAVAGLASQDFVRAINKGDCLYRAPDGKRCAIGHCIPDSLYKESFESRGASAVLRELGVKNSDLRVFASDLQGAHDLAYDPNDMKARLRRVGEAQGLVIPEVLREVAQ